MVDIYIYMYAPGRRPVASSKSMGARLGWTCRHLKARTSSGTCLFMERQLSGTRLQKWLDYVAEEGHARREEGDIP